MSPFDQLLSGPENVFWFLAGMVSVQVWQWIKCKYKDRVDPEGKPHHMKKVNWFYIWTALVLAVIVMVSFQNARTYTFAEQLAKDTLACQQEFNQALRARSLVTTQNDEWSQVQREALANWLHDLIYPPTHIGVLPLDHPERIEWQLQITQEADKIVRKAQNEQDENLLTRPPLPNPTCGK